MGMCKKCQEVFPASEMKDGLCSNCYISDEHTVENINIKSDLIQNSTEVQSVQVTNNYKLATIISIIATSVGVILVLVGLFGFVIVLNGKYMPDLQKVIMIAGSIVNLIGGMILILTGQVAKATTDNANYSKAIFELLKNKEK